MIIWIARFMALMMILPMARAATISISDTFNVLLTDSGITLNILTGGTCMDSFIVNPTNVSFTLPAGCGLEVANASGLSLANDSSVTVNCSSNTSRISITGPKTVVVTPTSTNVCSGGGSSGGGGGGGGGGGDIAPVVTTTTPPTTPPVKQVTELATSAKTALKEITIVKDDDADVKLPKGTKIIGAKKDVTINGFESVKAEEQKTLKVAKAEEIVKAFRPDLSTTQVKFNKKVEILIPVQKKEKLSLYLYDEKGKASKVNSAVVLRVEDGEKKYYVRTTVNKISEKQTFVLTHAKKK